MLVERQTTGAQAYHWVLQQVLQFAQAAAFVTGVLSFDGVLELPKIWLAVPGVAHELIEGTDIKTLYCCQNCTIRLKKTIEKGKNKTIKEDNWI